MKVHEEELADVTRYIANNQQHSLDDYEAEYQNYLRLIRKCHPVDESTKMLEIGIGTGWFPVMCAKRGLSCKGLEISHQLIEFAKEFGLRYGVAPEFVLGNIEEDDLGREQYDVVLAQSIFEHVEHWELATKKVYDSLKPGGLFVFSSTNKFSFVSGEYHFPLYGWLPDQWRYSLRKSRQGPDIMKLGIDFNQFRYPLLRRVFKETGFKTILDRVQLAQPEEITSGLKRSILKVCKASGLIKSTVLTFSDATVFLCVK